MKHTLLFCAQLFALAALSQGTDIELYTEDGERFFLSVNGKKINHTSETAVTAYDITGEFAQVKVDFEDGGIPTLSKNMMLESGKAIRVVARKNKKGRYVYRMMGTAPKTGPGPGTEVPATTVYQTATTSGPSGGGSGSGTTTTTMTTTTTDGDKPLLDLTVKENGEVSMGVNIPAMDDGSQGETSPGGDRTGSPGGGGNITARVQGKKIVLSDGRTLNWAYTKTKRLTGVEIEMEEPVGAEVAISYDGQLAKETEVPFFYREPDWKRGRDYFKLTVREQDGTTWSVKLQHSNNYRILINGLTGEGSSGPTNPSPAPTPTPEPVASAGCSAMADGGFQRAVQSIKNKIYAEEKMTVAKQVIKGNCLNVQQVKTVMGLFTYEEHKIAWAKAAYARTVDQNNYYQVNDGLTYSDSVEALNAFLEQQQ